MRLGKDLDSWLPVAPGMPAPALLLADQGNVERAVELYALVPRYPIVVNSHWFEDVAGKRVSAAAATLPSEVVAAAQERGRARDLWTTVEELLVELEEETGPCSPRTPDIGESLRSPCLHLDELFQLRQDPTEGTTAVSHDGEEREVHSLSFLSKGDGYDSVTDRGIEPRFSDG
jgi:hypothetical protein